MHDLAINNLFEHSLFSFDESLEIQLFELNYKIAFSDVQEKENQELNSQEYKNIYLLAHQSLDKEIKNSPNFSNKENLIYENKLEFPKEAESTGEKANQKILFEKKINKGAIFEIKKVEKILGRKKKNIVYLREKMHTKKRKDNIITKIKKNLYNHSLKFVNLLISKSQNEEIRNIKLKKIENKIMSVSKKEENLQLLDLTLKQIFSNKLSKKYIYLQKDYNEITINKIFQKNEKDIIYALNKTLREILSIYCNDNDNIEDNIFKDFKRLKDDIKDFKKKKETESYINLYNSIAKEYETKLKKIYSRRKRNNEKI